jgi:hypothetical protein
MLPDRTREAGIGFDWKDVALIHAVPPKGRASLPDRLRSTIRPEGAGVCDHAVLPVLVLTILLYFARRVKPTTVALLMLEGWRRLPPQQRQQLLLAARRHGPRMASSLVRRRGLPRA